MYRNLFSQHDLYPPFPISSLIRQAIYESGEDELTEDEIKSWIKNNFMFYRQTEIDNWLVLTNFLFYFIFCFV